MRTTKTFIAIVILLSSTISVTQNQSSTITIEGTQIHVSSILQEILNQTEAIYLSPSGHTLEVLYNVVPHYLPTLVGLIMQRQTKQMMQIKNLDHIDNSLALENEIMSFLSQLAEAYKFKNPSDGSSMTAAKLQAYYYMAVQGEQNAHYIQSMGIDPARVQIAYLLDKNPSLDTPARESGKLILKKEENNEINLFGEIADAAKSNHIPRDKEKEKVVTADTILGTWCYLGNPNNQCITFQKNRIGYVGTIIDKHDDFILTMQYSVTKTEIITNHPLLPAYRNYTVNILYTCNPPHNYSYCGKEPRISHFSIYHNSNTGSYGISNFSGGPLGGFEKK